MADKVDQIRLQARQLTLADEQNCVEQLLLNSKVCASTRERVLKHSRVLVERCREDKAAKGVMDAFLQEFGLSNKEGVALMCLAEALLRVPDPKTADRLIAEKISDGDWLAHLGKSASLFVNTASLGLLFTGKVITLDVDITDKPKNWFSRLVNKLGAPTVRVAVLQAMRMMGGQYVLGQTIQEGIDRGVKENPAGTSFSFDMLGESARTEEDAQRYYHAYMEAIETIGANHSAGDVRAANGISVKLSALHSRYHYSHHELVMAELLPRIKALCCAAKKYNLGLSIDAEESERLDISLDIFESLARDSELKNWQGLGFVLQAYQKRAPVIVDWLVVLGRETQRQIMVRLVKGAYWDAEIKRAQELGLSDYPVYTRKANTDLCYQVCAEKLLAAQDVIYPQFATHNAYTACLVLELARGFGLGKGSGKGPDQDFDKCSAFEFQRLHGMGHILYQQLQADIGDQRIQLRVYAPIGEHCDLLPYLVRRLLENGANSSFVNRFLDKQTPVDELMADVQEQVMEADSYRHEQIPLPLQIYRVVGEARDNAQGIDLDSPLDAENLLSRLPQPKEPLQAAPIVGGNECIGENSQQVVSPADTHQVVGYVTEATSEHIEQAIDLSAKAQPTWNSLGVDARASVLDKMADALEAHSAELIGLIVAEAGRTVPDALSELREAVDFCRYYSLQARQLFSDSTNINKATDVDEVADGLHQNAENILNAGAKACGVFLCISPWNFPLAIFTGQVAAALVVGNSVLAKPAEQTPLVAARAVELFLAAGVSKDVLHLLPGDGARIGRALLSDARLSGVAFTGSTQTARLIYQRLASRLDQLECNASVPLIAETGGQNAMIVDSTALPEQVVDDVIASAFLSAGQRCSALRVLYLQEDIADKVLHMLAGAMASLHIGDPVKLNTDIGPVIDAEAQQKVLEHIDHLYRAGKFVARVKSSHLEQIRQGTFVAPHVFEIDSMQDLSEEIFGPVLHVVRYQASQLDTVLEQIRQSGYGLTLGVHSRIQAMADYVFRNSCVGNTYINRNMVGAVVGVNPFGGYGLSGTGPKAGGPNYLLGFMRVEAEEKIERSSGPAAESETLAPITFAAGYEDADDGAHRFLEDSLMGFTSWQRTSLGQRAGVLAKAAHLIREIGELGLADAMDNTRVWACTKLGEPLLLPGPTGEENLLSLQPRGPVLCFVDGKTSDAALATQLVMSLIAGCSLIIYADALSVGRMQKLVTQFDQASLLSGVLQLVDAANAGLAACLMDQRIAVVSLADNSRYLRLAQMLLAEREGAIIPLVCISNRAPINFDNSKCRLSAQMALMRFVVEKTRTENLVAKGGNTQLFNLQE